MVISCHDHLTGESVAVKKIARAFENIIDSKRVCREIKLLRHLEHENLMSICDIVQPSSFPTFTDVYIVSPLMETDLHRIIYSRQDLTDDHVQYFVYQILRGLKYMHSANVIHRDLKPSNILLNSNCDLKICDFGLARGLEETGMLTEYVVTRWYRAPEIMLSCQEYSKAVDVWSVGCIFAELVGRRPLFAGDDYIHQLQMITDVLGSPTDADLEFVTSHKALRFMQNMRRKKRKPFTALYPRANPESLRLLTSMLLFDPSKRINVSGALAHPYMESLHCEEDEPSCAQTFNHQISADCHPNDLKVMVFEDMCAFHPEASVELPTARAHRNVRNGQPFTSSIRFGAPAATDAPAGRGVQPGLLPNSSARAHAPAPGATVQNGSSSRLPAAVSPRSRTAAVTSSSQTGDAMPPINGAVGAGLWNSASRPATSPRSS